MDMLFSIGGSMDIGCVSGIGGISRIEQMTQEEYDTLTEKDPETLYFIVAKGE